MQVKAKGERKIGLEQFKQALELIAAKKKKSVDELVGMMQASNGTWPSHKQVCPADCCILS